MRIGFVPEAPRPSRAVEVVILTTAGVFTGT
jgi:hypothetical protein